MALKLACSADQAAKSIRLMIAGTSMAARMAITASTPTISSNEKARHGGCGELTQRRRESQPGKAAIELREAFGVRRIPALCIPRVGDILAPAEETAPGYGALQTLREQERTRIRRSLRTSWS